MANIRNPLAASIASSCMAVLAPFFAAHAAAPASAEETVQPGEAQAIVIHLGNFTDDLHSTFMALGLATNLQLAGAEVTVFVDREGVRLADASERGDLTWGDSGGTADALADFVKAGGTVLLCPHCASLAGVVKDSLRPGARIATEEEVAALFLDADKVIDF